MDQLNKMRKEYRAGSLNEVNMATNPLEEFRQWLETAIASGLSEPNAMTIASVSQEGKPSARVVLLKELNDRGFVFYTNYMSRKGRELFANPFAAIVFDWHELERQVRIEGVVEKVEENESDAYFNVRPDDAKIGAWASPQSSLINSREELEASHEKYSVQFAERKIPRPPHWGGYLIIPTLIEFWQGRPNRMHDRIVYNKSNEGWHIQRLAP